MYSLVFLLTLSQIPGQAPVQCFDQYGRPVPCYGNADRQTLAVSPFLTNTSGRAPAIAESFREVPLSQTRPAIRIDFFGIEPPEEIVIRGQVWRRIR